MQLRPEWDNGEKLQMICGVAPAHKPMLAQQVAGKLPFGVSIEWKGEQRLLQTGKPDLLKSEKEQWRQASRVAGAVGGPPSLRGRCGQTSFRWWKGVRVWRE